MLPGTAALADEVAGRLALRSALGSECQGKQKRRERQEYHADLDCNSSHITFLIGSRVLRPPITARQVFVDRNEPGDLAGAVRFTSVCRRPACRGGSPSRPQPTRAWWGFYGPNE